MTANRTSSPASAAWPVTAGLLLLSVIPVIFGALRLVSLVTGAAVTPDNIRFIAAPLPVVIHVICSAAYALAGAFQFVTGNRRRAFGWHRAAGRVLVVCGLLVALSGLWMTLFYTPPAGQGGVLLYAFRFGFGSAMVVSLGLGFEAILRRRDVPAHRAWMMRAYAIGLGAGTQVLTGLAESLLASPRTELSHALALGAGWIINLAVAEWAIRRRPARRAPAVTATAS
ncbi:MAG: DUF2306 domain-containing protein [Anaerolineales bacterium]|nr:DUF2306 domain-containing protein [Anaerolineales bacterium]